MQFITLKDLYLYRREINCVEPHVAECNNINQIGINIRIHYISNKVIIIL